MDAAQKKRFCTARRAVIEREFSALNPRQKEGALATEGPLLLLAGAGSGKTTVLIWRIANLLRYGRGSDSDDVPAWAAEDDLRFLEACASGGDAPEDPDRLRRLSALDPAPPWSVLAITFTNRAASELKERLEGMLGTAAGDIWASTFHSSCLRILRREAEAIGYGRDFTIYDTDDSIRVMKDVLTALNLDEKMYPPRTVLGHISRAKDALCPPEELLAESERSGDFRKIGIARAYAAYQKRLRDANAMDFDDLIYCTVRLLLADESVRRFYQKKFRYVLIDEYQDTNHLQYLLASTLAGGTGNLCVVGDDDQSIYRFRGATIENILRFEEQFPGARVIRLEQNYRSTGNILAAANAVIRNNQGRKGKELWTRHPAGDPVTLYHAADERDEAQHIAARILDAYAKGRPWRESAVLYRMNAQSNELEYAFRRSGIPYRVYGGTRFFDRAEVKDMIAYLCVIQNPADTLRLLRVINNPARGIGGRTVAAAEELAGTEGLPLYEILLRADRCQTLVKYAGKIRGFTDLIEELRRTAEAGDLPALYEAVMERTGYLAALEAKDTVENRSRAENVRELMSSVERYVQDEPEPTLAGFLDLIALYTDWDDAGADGDCVCMMSMHSAKGLEYPAVYLAGMEEGVFPSYRSLDEAEGLEEERRLCYVGMTRAMRELTLIHAQRRTLFGRTTSNQPSRFLSELPEDLLSHGGGSRPPAPAFSGVRGDETRPAAASTVTRGGETRPAADPAGVRGRAQTAAAGGARRPTGARGLKTTVGAVRPSAAAAQTFREGDAVEHRAFGAGVVTRVQPMGGDALLEVAFETSGTRRLMANTAVGQMTKKEL